MSYNNPGEVLTAIGNSIRTLYGSTSSIPYVEMPGLIKDAIDEPIDLSNYDGTNWILPFIDHIHFNSASGISYMFSYIDCDAQVPIHSLDLEKFSIAGRTSLRGLFTHSKFTEISNIEDWDTSNITDITGIFQNAHISDSLDLSNWDVSNASWASVSTADRPFNWVNIVGLNLSGWDFSSGPRIFTNFFDYANIQNLNLSNWKFASGPMSGMFFHATIGSLDFTGWDTSGVTSMYQMFDSATITKMWVPSTFVATAVSDPADKPFKVAPAAAVEVYTNATDAETQGWGDISVRFHMHYNSTYQDFINA